MYANNPSVKSRNKGVNLWKQKVSRLVTKFSHSAWKFYIFCSFWLLVAILALLQDYLHAIWLGGNFQIYDSLVYKIFWLLFIPFTLVYFSLFTKLISKRIGSSKVRVLTTISIVIILISLTHLFIFSLLLSGISVFIQDEPWKLSWLIQEKLSTKLYIALSVYTALSYMFFKTPIKNKNLHSHKSYSTILPVKNGSTSEMVAVKDITWIKSEGVYLELHTGSRKYVIINSLKNILNQLDPTDFKRIHKSTIVNLKMVCKIKSRHNGDYDISLKDGTELRLSRNYTKSLKGILL